MVKYKKICLMILMCIIIFNGFLSINIKGACTKEAFYIIENEKNNSKYIVPTKEEVINELCSDELSGRRAGSEGNVLAEEYIEDIFYNIGLEPFFKDTFKQYFSCYTVIDGVYNEKKISNVIGKISGSNSEKALIISAHFDHIGYQLNGEMLRGAIDNASGTALLIDLAMRIKELANNDQFEYDIIFAGFNGEELGLVGSQFFANRLHKYYENVYDINIDCVGYNNGGDIVLTNNYNKVNKFRSDEKYNNLYTGLKNSFENIGINVSDIKEVTGLSDDFSFQSKGYTSISIIEENIFEIIHTPNDTPDVIDYNKLNLIEEAIYQFVTKFEI